MSPFKLVGASVQSTTDSRGVRISSSNAGYAMFRGSVKGTGYPLHSPVHLNRWGRQFSRLLTAEVCAISGSNAGYTMFRGSVKGTGYPLHSPVHLNRWGRQFSRLLTAEVCASAVVMLDTPCSEVVWRVLATHCIRQFPLHLPSRASPCAFTFQPDSSTKFTTANYSARTHTHTHIHTLVKFSHIHTNTQKHIEQTTILNRLA